MGDDRSKPNGVSETVPVSGGGEAADIEDAKTKLKKTASRANFDPRKSKGVRNKKTDGVRSRKVQPL